MEYTSIEEKDYPHFLRLYNQSFPEAERRLYEDEKELARFVAKNRGKFHAFAAKDGDLFLGFLSYWEFPDWIYVEHFAVDPAHRNKRLGTDMLHHLFKTVGEDVLLEVEHPDNEDSRRRIAFYERNGFRPVKEFEYMQPAYSPSQNPVPMLLMKHGDIKIRDYSDLQPLLKDVYGLGD